MTIQRTRIDPTVTQWTSGLTWVITKRAANWSRKIARREYIKIYNSGTQIAET